MAGRAARVVSRRIVRLCRLRVDRRAAVHRRCTILLRRRANRAARIVPALVVSALVVPAGVQAAMAAAASGGKHDDKRGDGATHNRHVGVPQIWRDGTGDWRERAEGGGIINNFEILSRSIQVTVFPAKNLFWLNLTHQITMPWRGASAGHGIVDCSSETGGYFSPIISLTVGSIDSAQMA